MSETITNVGELDWLDFSQVAFEFIKALKSRKQFCSAPWTNDLTTYSFKSHMVEKLLPIVPTDTAGVYLLNLQLQLKLPLKQSIYMVYRDNNQNNQTDYTELIFTRDARVSGQTFLKLPYEGYQVRAHNIILPSDLNMALLNLAINLFSDIRVSDRNLVSTGYIDIQIEAFGSIKGPLIPLISQPDKVLVFIAECFNLMLLHPEIKKIDWQKLNKFSEKYLIENFPLIAQEAIKA